jgi:hypothetical protein
MKVLPTPGQIEVAVHFTRRHGMKAAKKVRTITKTPVQDSVSAVVIDLGDRWPIGAPCPLTAEVIDRGRVKTTAEALSEQAAG